MSRKFIDKILKKQNSGMALLMVISTIALLSYLLADFTFETQINQIKSFNAQDRIQARLSAEAGLQLSLGKLRIYQEARNKLEQNSSLKKLLKPSLIDKVVTQPFIFPIPVGKGMSAQQKSAIKSFTQGTAIRGQLNVTMSKVSGFLNPNNLRIVPPTAHKNQQNSNSRQSQNNNKKQPKSVLEITEKKMLTMLQTVFQKERQNSDFFNLNYSNLDPRLLIKELKYFVNNKGAINDPMFPEIDQIYSQAEVVAKHAPMTSIDEFYLLAGWPEYITNLVIDRFTVHEVGVIALNEINENTLRLIFPNITKLQSEQFFKYRDGDDSSGDKPHPFQNVKNFRDLVIGQLGIVTATQFSEREQEFKSANLSFGIAGKLYKVESVGTYNSSTVKLTAFIDLPIKPQPVTTQSPQNPQNPNGNPNSSRSSSNNQNSSQTGGNQSGKPSASKTQFMKPRIIEIRVD